jgi:uncharacterized membrane protein YkvA (DUF1232 family)
MAAAALDPFREHARRALTAGEDLGTVLEEAGQLAVHSPVLRDLVPALADLVTAHSSGEYDDAEPDDVELALAALLYVVSPWDQTPDYLPHGLRDDELVTRAVAHEIERTLREFQAWRNPRAQRPRRRG